MEVRVLKRKGGSFVEIGYRYDSIVWLCRFGRLNSEMTKDLIKQEMMCRGSVF